ncbi:MAG TPA: hypothetical protein VHE99_11280 [Gammaproteobacteria bacterium]|nr:hypothetical protein [Gammaproteobacteria bacterium]
MSKIKIAPECKELVWQKEVTWDKVRDKVMEINPALASIIDEFSPSSKYTLILASYPFGTNIRNKGELFLPTEQGQLATLDEPSISLSLRENLSYSSSPLVLILDKSVEIYVETPEQRTIPLKLFRAGVTLGVWELLKQVPVFLRRKWNWSISAGAHTLFMLPKIMDTASHRKLQTAYHTRIHVPNNIFEQSSVFTEIFNHTADKHPWATQVLFFTKKWFEPHPKNIGWFKLQEYWAQEAWTQLHYWYNKIVLDFNWEVYMAELVRRKIRLKPYYLDTVKHLISIGCGVIPGFRPADDSEQVGPTQTIQSAYVNDYGLKTYIPILMYPDFLNPSSEVDMVYYSLQAPSLPEKPSEFGVYSSVLTVMRELKEYMDIFLEILDKWPKSQSLQGFDFVESVKFEYFHIEADEQNGILHTSAISETDPAFSLDAKKYGKRKFPENSPFFKGCIRISFKTDSSHELTT